MLGVTRYSGTRRGIGGIRGIGGLLGGCRGHLGTSGASGGVGVSEVYWGLAGTLGTEIAWREREIARERERLCPSVKWWKHGNGTISIIQDLHICLEREREAMSICEMAKIQKWYYLRNMRSGYFPINSKLHRERGREQDREREGERERGRGYVHPWNGENTETVLSL